MSQNSNQVSVQQPGRRFSSTSTVPGNYDARPGVFATDRPTTSMTERPETSMSVRTTTTVPALQVKKTRTSNATKQSVPAKAARAKKTATSTATNTSSKTSSPAGPQPSETAGDLDKIVTGIKKITLVTNKQKQARAQEAKNVAGTSAPIADNQVNAQSVPTTPVGVPRSAPHSGKGQEPEVKREIPDTPISNANDSVTAHAATPRIVALPSATHTPTAENFIHYQPDGPVPKTVLPLQQRLDWLPVNTGSTPTPSPAKQELHRDDAAIIVTSPSPEKHKQQRQYQPAISSPRQTPNDGLMSPSPIKRGDLPVFTPTSQIRFAGAPGSDEQKMGNSVWEVPETPQS